MTRKCVYKLRPRIRRIPHNYYFIHLYRSVEKIDAWMDDRAKDSLGITLREHDDSAPYFICGVKAENLKQAIVKFWVLKEEYDEEHTPKICDACGQEI